MRQVHQAVRAASVRLFAARFFSAMVVLLTAGAAGLLLATLLERLIGLEVRWPSAVWWTLGSATALSLAWAALTHERGLAAARVLDERAGLRESLSTALCVEKDQDPWSRAVVGSAVDKAKAVRVGQAIPIQAPRRWFVPVFAAIGLAIVWMSLPRYDLLGLFAKREEKKQHAAEILQVKADVKAKEDKLAEILAKAGVDLKKEKDEESAAGKPSPEIDPDEIRRAAVKRLTEINEKLNQMQNGERQQQAQSLQEQMRQLKQPGPGPLQDLARNLAKSDFAKAQENLAELKQKLDQSALSPAEKEQLQKQLESLGQQLKDQAAKQNDLKNQLQKAGLDQKAAEKLAKEALQNPEALKKAIEQMKNLSPEQQKKLAESAMSMAKSMSQCDKMGQSMSQMAKSMSKQGMGKEGQQSMQELAQQMGELEQMTQESKAMAAAMNETKKQLEEMGSKCETPGECEGCKAGGECKGGSCKNASLWACGNKSSSNGIGSSGRDTVLGAEQQASDYRTESRKADSQAKSGPIIGTRLVYGDQVRGESTAEFATAVEAAKGSAAEAIEAMRVPREYQDAVKKYFGTLEKKADDAKGKSAPSAAPAAPAPAAPAAATPNDGK
ncbi:MAG: hypothetical protein U0573_00905 [Phycisphaerales bacterium]|nr:hypothetical protein [Planctomycetota bacterium]